MTQIPQASFVSMVDAVLCTVSIFIILIVSMPRSDSNQAFVAQVDTIVTCSMRDPLSYSVGIRTGSDSPWSIEITEAMSFSTQVEVLRARIAQAMIGESRLSMRFGVVFKGSDRPCVDAVLCALATQVAGCVRRDLEFKPWDDDTGLSRPIVTVIYGDQAIVARP